jgi:anthranilate/para-aminobenzoate synthase component I
MNKGFDVYTDFSDKVVIQKSNLKNFIKKTTLSRKKYNKFFNGYIGFLSYELCCELIGVKIPNQQSNNFYKSIFYKPQTVIKIRRNIRIQSILSNFKSLDNLKKSKKKYVYQRKFKVNLSLGQYSKLFDKFIKKIKRGETYQIKICQKYRNNSRIDSVRFFWNLMKINKSPESFVIRDLDYSIVSCSPETLIEKKNNMIATKPIAGTLKKTSSTSKNKAKIYFQNNEKESKEHNMIVDMERNDLSRICKKGSVRISKLKYVEEYKDLYHYVTKVVGKLDGSKKIIDIIKAMLPGGSVIGCPKINTLNLLNHHEKDNRNIYTGSFGYIKSNGDMRFNIMIRTILNFKDVCEISVASGVVWGSTAKKEYNENFIKAKSLLDIFKS